MGAIYRVWNEENGKSYVGQSDRPYNRIKEHLTPGSKRGSRRIQEDLLKYPPEVWNWEIVVEGKYSQLSGVTLNKLEVEYIGRFDSYNNGYNMTQGGGVGKKSSRRTRKSSWRTWKPRSEDSFRLNQQQMLEGIRRAIGNYQCYEFYGISLKEFLRQQEIKAQYGSLEAYETHLERERERDKMRQQEEAAERRRRQNGCFFWCVIAFLGIIISLLAGNC